MKIKVRRLVAFGPSEDDRVCAAASGASREPAIRLLISVRPRLALNAIFLAVAVAGGSSAHAAELKDVAVTVDDVVRPLMAEYDVPGIAVAVTAGGESRVFTYGVASRETNQPVTPDTLFEIGSLSKTFTATLVSYAESLGELSLDDHPGKYVPELRGAPIDRASLLELGCYVAGGLPLQFPEDVALGAGMVAFFRDWKPTAKPGSVRRYSNPSIGLLGHIAGIAIGSEFQQTVETQLFPQLGLKNTFIHVPDPRMSSYAWGYGNDGRPIRVRPGVLDAEAYAVKSTAADMIRFVEANIRPETLDSPMRQAIEGTHTGRFAVGPMTQGLGWEQYPWPVSLEALLTGNSSAMILEPAVATRLTPSRVSAGVMMFNKTGSTNGFGAYAAFVRGAGIGIVILANRNFPIPARVAAAYAVLKQLSPGPR